MQQRQASPHTISSYRDTFRHLLVFVHQRVHTPPSRLRFEEMDAPLIVAFLDDLERHGLSIRSRNLRLTAVHSFFRYAAYELTSTGKSSSVQRTNSCKVSASTRVHVDRRIWASRWTCVWRRGWDSNSVRPFRICNLQIPKCRHCRKCHRCRGALHLGAPAAGPPAIPCAGSIPGLGGSPASLTRHDAEA
jgi:hypothetical protein